LRLAWRFVLRAAFEPVKVEFLIGRRSDLVGPTSDKLDKRTEHILGTRKVLVCGGSFSNVRLLGQCVPFSKCLYSRS
jgi:hypothetical protein